jgi:hypothetical protein
LLRLPLWGCTTSRIRSSDCVGSFRKMKRRDILCARCGFGGRPRTLISSTLPLTVISWLYLPPSRGAWGGPDPKQPWAPSAMRQLCYWTTRWRATSECEHDGNGEDEARRDARPIATTMVQAYPVPVEVQITLPLRAINSPDLARKIGVGAETRSLSRSSCTIPQKAILTRKIGLVLRATRRPPCQARQIKASIAATS